MCLLVARWTRTAADEETVEQNRENEYMQFSMALPAIPARQN